MSDNYSRHIDFLYPPDSEHADTRAEGERIMLEAMRESGFDWRTLPVEVRARMASKCIQLEQRQTALQLEGQ